MSLSNMINKIKDKTGGSSKQGQDKGQEQEEQRFTIQPHPAKTNDPADLTPNDKQQVCFGANPNANSAWAAHNAAPGPYVPSQEQWSGVEQPKGRDELRARAAELNDNNRGQ